MPMGKEITQSLGSKHSLTSLDLFCGPGGFSEGLRMAGIRSVMAIDYEKDACATFALNHPEVNVVCADVLDIDPRSLPDTDIIVGGPPCVNFSTSKGSRANVLEGLRLVQWFLSVVAIKKPRYWIMENVPQVAKHLPNKIPLSWFGVSGHGELPVPARSTLCAADYGVAQLRVRHLVGNFPLPKSTHTDELPSLFETNKLNAHKTLGSILTAFPALRSTCVDLSVVDPNYGFSLPFSQLTDHFLEVSLTKAEVEKIRDAKTNHPYMGRMSFPDVTDRPARTVVATQLGRETLVLKTDTSIFRRATVRECASIQSFPITYQFTGRSIGSRYRQAGDAVPPLLIYAIGKEITGCQVPAMRSAVSLLSDPIKAFFKRSDRKRSENPKRSFSAMIPGKEVRGSRVELDNFNLTKFGFELDDNNELRRLWSTRLHLGEGKKLARSYVLPFSHALGSASLSIAECGQDIQKRWQRFCAALLVFTINDLDPLIMQSYWCKFASGNNSPTSVVKRLAILVNRHFPAKNFSESKLNFLLPNGEFIQLRVRLIMATVACSAFLEALYGNTEKRNQLFYELSELPVKIETDKTTVKNP